jgi:hypothetical protein
VLRLTFYIGGKPVHRYELRNIKASDGEFRVDLPPDITVAEGSSPSGRPSNGRPEPPNLPLAIATAIGRQAAAEASKAARNLLKRIQERQQQDRP